jgi:hypothetical protein
MSSRIRLDSFLVDGEADAWAALRAVGAAPIPELTLTSVLPEVGPVVRRFGVVWTLPGGGPVRVALDAVSGHPTNLGTWGRVVAGKVRHVPGSRWVAEELATSALPVHLPWALRPLSMDLAGVLEEWAELSRPSFGAWFSQNVEVDDDEIVLRRVFSLPVRGSAEGTLHDPAVREALDPDVGLLLEVDALR